MNHKSEEELFAFRDGEPRDREAIAAHLRECDECRKQLERMNDVFSAMDTIPLPDPGENYGQQVWQRIASRLEAKKTPWWQSLFAARQFVLVGAAAALVLLAFFAGRWTKPSVQLGESPDAAKVRERVLVVAVGEHLGRTEMVLMELENAPARRGQKPVDISSTQRRAEDLVEENRLYRQTALKEGDQVMASTLDELERTLLEIANGPAELTPAAFESMRKRIESQGLLFKVRVVKQGLDKRKSSPARIPADLQKGTKEGKKHEDTECR